MDSGICAKTFDKPWSRHKRAWPSEGFFPAKNNSIDFSRWWPKAFFPGGQQKGKSFFKFQHPKGPRSPCPFLFDAHVNYNYVHIRKTRLSRNKLTGLPCKLGLCNRNLNFRLRLRLHVQAFSFCSSYNHPKFLWFENRLHRLSICFKHYHTMVA